MKNTILKGVRTIKTGLTSYSGTVSEFRFWLQKQDLAVTIWGGEKEKAARRRRKEK